MERTVDILILLAVIGQAVANTIILVIHIKEKRRGRRRRS